MLHETVTVRIFGDEKLFGPGMAELLHGVDEHGSLRGAALSMEMAYSKAWAMIRRCEAGMGFRLLASVTGGKNGGGAVLTENARALLADYEAYRDEIAAFAHSRFSAYFEHYNFKNPVELSAELGYDRSSTGYTPDEGGKT